MLKPFLIFILLVSAYCVKCDEQLSEDVLDDSVKEENVEIPKTGLVLEHEILDEQADQPSSGEQFFAVPLNTVGNREEINPTLKTLANIAIKYLPKNLNFLNVLSATREVVAGVRFNIVINANDENGIPVICELQIMEKPWLTTEWGDKYRYLEYTNCTEDGQAFYHNEDEENLKINSLFTHRSAEITEEKLKKLEEEILPTKSPVEYNVESLIINDLNKEPVVSMKKASSNNFVEKQINDDEIDGELEEVHEEIIVPKKAYVTGSRNTPKKDVENDSDDEDDSNIETFESSQPKLPVTTTPENIHVDKSVEVFETTQSPRTYDVEDPKYYPPATEPNYYYPVETEPNFIATPDVIYFDLKQLWDDFFLTNLHLPESVDQVLTVSNDENFQNRVDGLFTQLDHSGGYNPENNVALTYAFPQITFNNGYIPQQSENLKLFFGPDFNCNCDTSVKSNMFKRDLVAAKNSSSSSSSSEESKEGVKSKVKVSSESSQESKEVKKVEEPKTLTEEVHQQRKKRAIEEQDNIMILARQALQQLDLYDADDMKRVTLELIAAKKIENFDLNEKYYILRLKIANSKCEENDNRNDGSEDLSEGSDNECVKTLVKGTIKYCTIEIKVDEDKVKVVNSECNPPKRKGGIVGAPETAESHEIAASLINETLDHLKKTAGSKGADLKLLRIENYTKQVVSGMKYVINAVFQRDLKDTNELKCKVVIWDRPWIKEEGREVEFDCEGEEEKIKIRHRRQTLGGVSESDDHETASSLINETLDHLKKTAGGKGSDLKLVRIEKYTKQVVSGMKYVINAVFQKDGEIDELKCKVVIWDRPWIKVEGRQVEFDCEGVEEKLTVRHRRQVPGGVSESNDHEKASSLINETLDHLKKTAGGKGSDLKLVRIEKYTKQVVSGMKYVIHAVFQRDQDTNELKCKVEIWDQPWIKVEGRQVEFDCEGEEENLTVRHKRQTLGGVSESANCDEATDLIKKSLNELKKTPGRDGSDLTLSRVDNCKSQVVSGTKHIIEAFFLRNSNEVKCNVEIWDQSWLENGREVTFHCDDDKKKVNFRYKRSLIYDRRNPDANKRDDSHAAHLFHKFKLAHQRNYANNMEHNMRFRIFKTNLNKIESLNRHEQGTAKYGVTEFSDLTATEYRMRTGLLPHSKLDNEIRNPIAQIDENIELPESFDWREKNAVTKVKNQGNCGSCWAFSVTGNVEGLHAVKTGVLEEYSEQELIDCDTVDSGCNGGLPDNAYKAIETIGGLELESDYPYDAKKETCNFNKTLSHVAVKGAVDLPKNETAMAQWLISNGPISIGINAAAMQFYRGGVSHPWKMLCRKGALDHGVLIVGYGIVEYPIFNKTMPYWIVKNSWGPSWGEQGYYRIYRGDNSCGVSEMASSAVLA